MRASGILSRNLLVLSLVSLLNDFSTDLVFPLLPYFIYALGGTALVIGFMEGLADSVAAFLRYLSGRLSDRIGQRKRLTVVGYAMSGIAKLFYPGATHWGHVVAIRGSDRVGKGFREAPRDAIIAESVEQAYWGFAFGFHRMLDTTGALLGPLAGLVLLHYLGTSSQALRTIFFIAAIPGIIALFLFVFVRETGSGRRLPAGAPFVPKAALRGPLSRYLAVTALFTLGHLGAAFLILRATDLGMSLVAIIFLYTCFNVAEAVGSLPVGYMTDRVGRAPLLTIAYGLFALTFGLLVLAAPANWWSLLPFFVLLGLSRAFREGQGRAFVADLSPAEIRATGFGAYHATVGLLALPAGLVAGRLWMIDYRLTFLVAQVFCSAALILFLWNWMSGGFGRREEYAQHDHGPAHVH